MHDNWLIAIAMSTAGVGITMLLFALIVLDPAEKEITQITSMQNNAPIKITGTISSSRTIGNKTLITISQPSTIDIIIEDIALNTTSLKRSSCIQVNGKTSEYNGKRQIIASKVELCKSS
jgi:aspartyl/asparaginyl-tRNA synthetase